MPAFRVDHGQTRSHTGLVTANALVFTHRRAGAWSHPLATHRCSPQAISLKSPNWHTSLSPLMRQGRTGCLP